MKIRGNVDTKRQRIRELFFRRWFLLRFIIKISEYETHQRMQEALFFKAIYFDMIYFRVGFLSTNRNQRFRQDIRGRFYSLHLEFQCSEMAFNFFQRRTKY